MATSAPLRRGFSLGRPDPRRGAFVVVIIEEMTAFSMLRRVIYLSDDRARALLTMVEAMVDEPPPTGQRFSQVYIQRGEPTQDSKRMRRRLAATIKSDRFNPLSLRDFPALVPQKLGVEVQMIPPYGAPDWVAFCRDCELKDLLDFVTLAYGYFGSSTATRWCQEVRRIFEEENVHYTVDDRGGVHFKIDAEFEHNRAATIACLQDARYRNALNEFEGAMAALAKAPPDGKLAIRATFGAAEGLFRLMFPNSPRLTAQEAQRLEPLIQGLHAADGVARGARSKLLNSFKDWIDAAHFYRHEAGHEEPIQPPLTLAVQMVSVGASFIRWLGELDGSTQQQSG
jgi:hypothetical protein